MYNNPCLFTCINANCMYQCKLHVSFDSCSTHADIYQLPLSFKLLNTQHMVQCIILILRMCNYQYEEIVLFWYTNTITKTPFSRGY